VSEKFKKPINEQEEEEENDKDDYDLTSDFIREF
jgi:hypothetical protein